MSLGYNRVNRGRNAFLVSKEKHQRMLFSVHRARVTDVHVDKGTVNVHPEGDINPYPGEVQMPLLGLSMPPAASEDDNPETRASWGRYIPQVGDMVLMGYSPNGDPYIFGYHAVFYQGVTKRDDNRSSVGGIGWGASSGKRMKPGDWDFKSARGSSLYLGEKARLASGGHSLTLNKNEGSARLKSDLIIESYGTSEYRKGTVRRQLLPTDPEETIIYSAYGVAQESTNVVKRGFPQIEMVRTSMGDVTDETTKQVMMSTLGGTTIRKLTTVKDPTGFIDFYSEKIDDAGNYGVDALTSIMFQWNTPLATWNVTNAVTGITSSTSFSVTSPFINLIAATEAVIESISVKLGGAAAVEPVVLGNILKTWLTSLVNAIVAHTHPTGTGPSGAPLNAAQFSAMTANIDAALSQISKSL